LLAFSYLAIACWVVAGIIWWKKRIIALAIELVGCLLWFALIADLGLKAGYWPLSTPEEFLLVTIGFAALIHALAEIGGEGKEVGWLLPFTAAILAFLGKGAFTTEPLPLPPAFRIFWFQFHTLTASIAYGAFLVAGTVALAIMLKPTENSPKLATIMALGYIALTLSMLLGSIWGELSWGSYWAWSLKEIWALALWLVGTLYFHTRALPRWRGRWTLALPLIMAGIALFSLLGTGWLARRLTLETLYIF
jgi:ABC-type transport system involved in cytochrome c biogenesis permease subunit